jgi:hypothetical protein
MKVSGVSSQKIPNNKFQIPNGSTSSPPHHPEQVEGQITMTEIQNPKQLAFDPPTVDLDIVIWNLFAPILKSGGACYLLFSVYPV